MGSLFEVGVKFVEYGGGSIDELNLSNLSSRGIMNEGKDILQLPHQILQHITSLNLSRCGLDHRGFENHAECIPYLCGLTSLNIQGNPGGVGSLVKMFQALDTRGIKIGKDDVAALSDLVQPSSSLRDLTVGESDFSKILPPQICQQLVRTVLDPPSSLKTLLICSIVSSESPLE